MYPALTQKSHQGFFHTSLSKEHPGLPTMALPVFGISSLIRPDQRNLFPKGSRFVKWFWALGILFS